jgi:hypothetical protein
MFLIKILPQENESPKPVIDKGRSIACRRLQTSVPNRRAAIGTTWQSMERGKFRHKVAQG